MEDLAVYTEESFGSPVDRDVDRPPSRREAAGSRASRTRSTKSRTGTPLPVDDITDPGDDVIGRRTTSSLSHHSEARIARSVSAMSNRSRHDSPSPHPRDVASRQSHTTERRETEAGPASDGSTGGIVTMATLGSEADVLGVEAMLFSGEQPMVRVAESPEQQWPGVEVEQGVAEEELGLPDEERLLVARSEEEYDSVAEGISFFFMETEVELSEG